MKVKELREALADVPEDAEIELGRFIAMNQPENEAYEVRLDFPVIGYAFKPEEENVITLMVDSPGDAKLWLLKMGKVTKLF